MSRPTYILTLTPDSDTHPIPAHIRLRHVLKSLLRSYAFKAIDVQELTCTEPVDLENEPPKVIEGPYLWLCPGCGITQDGPGECGKCGRLW